MYRIRFHGRGGQGIKTASRVLGSALFLEGYQVQDAPRYGAERRGAPIFAYVRADRKTINERGIIQYPDLVIVADDSLMTLPAAGVMSGVTEKTVVLLLSELGESHWQETLPQGVTLLVVSGREFEADSMDRHFTGMVSAGAAAALIKDLSKAHLLSAVRQELSSASHGVLQENLAQAESAYGEVIKQPLRVEEGSCLSAASYVPPDWIDVPFEEASQSAPVIHATRNSERSKTGLWRTMRPVIDYDKCNRCWWVCSTLCPDGAISVDKNQYPQIDLDHCKGCMVCVTVCPPKIIAIKPEVQVTDEVIHDN